MRERRLTRDLQVMTNLNKTSNLIRIEYEDELPDRYIVTYLCRSLIWIDGKESPSYSNRHEMEMYLHKDYPRFPPKLKWLTEIFHPNILSPQRNGGVCIGGWSAAESLDQLCLRIGEMVQYKSCNLNDPLDEIAANWIRLNRNILPIDNRDLI